MRNVIHIVGPIALLILLPCLSACSSCHGFWDRRPCVAGARQVAPDCCPPRQSQPRCAPPRQQCPPRCAPPRTAQCPPQQCPPQQCPPQYRDPCAPPATAPRTTYQAPPAEAPGGVQPGMATVPGNATMQDQAVLDRVNRIRAQRGLRALRHDGNLWIAARDHSAEQKRHGYMGHGSPDPNRRSLAQRMGQAGYGGRVFAEVVAWGYSDTAAVVDGWMNSPDHRRILLDPELTEAGFSRVGAYWTGNLGAPSRFRQATPAPNGAYSFRRAPAPAPRYTPVRKPAPQPTYTPQPRSAPTPAPRPRSTYTPPAPAPQPKPAPSLPFRSSGFG